MNIEERGEQTFGELYHIFVALENDIPIPQLPLSNRVINGLMRQHINTLVALLNTKTNALDEIKQFGKKSIDEIHLFLNSYSQSDSNSGNYKKTKENQSINPIARQHIEEIFSGKMDFVAELSDEEKDNLQIYIDALGTLGQELAEKCFREPQEVVDLVHIIYELEYKLSEQVEKDKKIKDCFVDIPEERHNQLAQGYINAYTREEKKRIELNSIFLTEENPSATLKEFSFERIYSSEDDYVSLLSFLKWCSFDIEKEIGALFDQLHSRESIKSVLTARSNGETLQIIGERLGITRERVRQIEVKARRQFGVWQSKKRILSKVSAVRNSDSVLSSVELRDYFGNYYSEMVYLLRLYESPAYHYDSQLDVFIMGEESLSNSAFDFVQSLPISFDENKFKDYLDEAIEQDIPEELFVKVLFEEYKKDGSTYHRIHQTLTEIYMQIMQSHYIDGINIYNEFEMGEFRRIALEEYGCDKLPTNDRAIYSRIQDICIMCDKGKYKPKSSKYISKELADKIHAYIVNSSASIFLTNVLYSIFEDELNTYGIDNKYYMQGVLRELYGSEFFFRRDYISKDDQVTSLYAEIVQFVKKYDYPITKEDVTREFPGLPEIVFQIAISDSNIINLFGKYLHGSKLKTLPSDVEYFKRVINRYLLEGDVCHYGEIYNYILRDDEDVLRRLYINVPTSLFSVLEYLLNGIYQFKRPFIAHIGTEIGDPAMQLKEIVLGSEVISFADITDFMKDNYYQVYSYLDYYNSFNQTHLLLNNEALATLDYIGINEESASAAVALLEDRIQECILIRDISCVQQLPRINVPWNEWLIYSVVRRWSTKLDVGETNSIFKLAMPVIAPKGCLNTAAFAGQAVSSAKSYIIDDLDNIDDLIADYIEINDEI